jgi:hypothetical protein
MEEHQGYKEHGPASKKIGNRCIAKKAGIVFFCDALYKMWNPVGAGQSGEETENEVIHHLNFCFLQNCRLIAGLSCTNPYLNWINPMDSYEGGTPGGNKLPGSGTAFFNFFNIKWIRRQHFALQCSYSLFGLLILHLNDSFPPA